MTLSGGQVFFSLTHTQFPHMSRPIFPVYHKHLFLTHPAWEESCILSPRSARLVALSATMSNARQITDWIGAIHGKATLVTTEERPVPLRFYFADELGMEPLFGRRGAGPGGRLPASGRERIQLWKLNGKLQPQRRQAERERRRKRRDGSGGRSLAFLGGKGGRGRGSGRGGAHVGGLEGGMEGGRRRSERSRGSGWGSGWSQRDMARAAARAEVPSMRSVLRCLASDDMLPAIVFIFSRAGCEKAAEDAATLGTPLVTLAEAAEVELQVGRTFTCTAPARVGHLHCSHRAS